MTDMHEADINADDVSLATLRRLDGSLLLVMRELLRTGNATMAAHRLRLSQSAVSHALTRLRILFDDPLFLRHPHGLTPTRRARELAPRVDQLLALTGELLGAPGAFDPASAQRVFAISAPEFVAVTIGAKLIRQIAELAPGCAVRIEHLDDASAFTQLTHGDLDAAIGRFDAGAVSGAFTRTLLYRDEYCLAARRGHPALTGGVTAASYQDLLHLFASAESEVSRRDQRVEGARLRLALVPRWLTALTVAAATDGVATCSRRLAESQAELLRLTVHELPFPTNPIDVALVFRRDMRDAGAEWLLSQIKAAAARDQLSGRVAGA
ncbi:MAG: LysR family transcriptional regulator [Pseudomonadales bacterium]|nr:LysR family transcriptional regulator [Pseudomonadales bacterium]MCP5185089.1 LysR family transcriptional regulator [Pseudomonadales bacterium]